MVPAIRMVENVGDHAGQLCAGAYGMDEVSRDFHEVPNAKVPLL